MSYSDIEKDIAVYSGAQEDVVISVDGGPMLHISAQDARDLATRLTEVADATAAVVPADDAGAVLACPHCGNADLWSDEVASIMYTVRLTRANDGGVDVDYTGVAREPQDEGTVYAGDVWCRACGTQLTESELVTEMAPRMATTAEHRRATCRNCGQPIEFNGFTWDHGPELGRHTVCDWHEGMQPTDRVATPADH